MSTPAHPVIQNVLAYGESALLPFVGNCASAERQVIFNQLQQYAPELYQRYADLSGPMP